MKRCPSQINREMQIKPEMRYNFTLIRMAIIKKSTNDKYWRGCGEKGTLWYFDGNIKWALSQGCKDSSISTNQSM